MSQSEEQVSEATREAEAEDERVTSGADRPPTADEEATADGLPPVDPEVAASYQSAAETGAHVEGEGKI